MQKIFSKNNNYFLQINIINNFSLTNFDGRITSIIGDINQSNWNFVNTYNMRTTQKELLYENLKDIDKNLTNLIEV